MTWSVIGFGEVARPVRLLNVPIGIWIVVAPWLLEGGTDLLRWADLATGLLVIGLSLPRGRIETKFGGWNRYLV